MTKNLPPRSIAFRRAMNDARETIAKDLFAADRVLEVASKAAATGENFIVIAPPRPVDLRGTDAAQALLTILEKEGFGTSWDSHEHPTNLALPPYFDLLIRWDVEPSGG